MGPSTVLGGRLHFHRRYYGSDDADLGADVVVCRHVLEHVADVGAFLQLLRGSVLRGKAYLETPTVTWTLEQLAFWDFFYEHCSYFSELTLASALARAGLHVTALSCEFGGQYLVAEAVPGPVGATLEPDLRAVELARRFGAAEPAVTAALADELRELARRGPVAL